MNGGPQPLVSSPVTGVSTLITLAPRSPRIIPACGPASARDRSMTTSPSRGPDEDSRWRAVSEFGSVPVTVVVTRSQPAGDDQQRPAEYRGEHHDRHAPLH